MGGVSSKNGGLPAYSDDFLGKGHARLSKQLRKCFSAGVKYNSTLSFGIKRVVLMKLLVKILIRGEQATGKSTLFRQLQDFSLLQVSTPSNGNLMATVREEPYIPTRQLQVTNIPWHYRGTNGIIPDVSHKIYLKSPIYSSIESNELVKIELWDVVDEGRHLVPSVNDYQQHDHHQHHDQVPKHTCETVDVSKLDDVYRHASGVIFMLDVTRSESIDYVVRGLPDVPASLPVLIIGGMIDKAEVSNAFPLDEEDFMRNRFQSIRNSAAVKESVEPGPVQFMLASLTRPSCPHNPPSGVMGAVFKFFELPFLKLQKDLLLTRLQMTEEKMERAQDEWGALLESSPQIDQHADDQDEKSELSTVNPHPTPPLRAGDGFSSESLTLGTGAVWRDMSSSHVDALSANSPNWNL